MSNPVVEHHERRDDVGDAHRDQEPNQELLKLLRILNSCVVLSGLVCSLFLSCPVLPGLAWSGLVWSGLVWPGLAWSGLVWSGLVWSGLFFW